MLPFLLLGGDLDQGVGAEGSLRHSSRMAWGSLVSERVCKGDHLVFLDGCDQFVEGLRVKVFAGLVEVLLEVARGIS